MFVKVKAERLFKAAEDIDYILEHHLFSSEMDSSLLDDANRVLDLYEKVKTVGYAKIRLVDWLFLQLFALNVWAHDGGRDG
jgi:hypothetical protein